MKSQDFSKRKPDTGGGGSNFSHASTDKGVRWDEIIYVLITLLVVFFVGRYVYETFFFLNANGYVTAPQVGVRFPADVKLLDTYVNEGEQVLLNDSLFSYISRDDMDEMGMYGSNAGENRRRQRRLHYEHEIRGLQQELRYKEIERTQKEQLVSFYESRAQRMRQEMYLDLHSRDYLESTTRDLEELNTEIIALTEQINFLQDQIANLQAQLNSIPEMGRELVEVNASRLGEGGSDNEFSYNISQAPLEGIVGKISRESEEVVPRATSVLTIYKPDSIYVESYFSFEQVSDLEVGDEVTIDFPDGSSEVGIVHKFKGSTSGMDNIAGTPLEGSSTYITVEIRPPQDDSTAVQTWQAYYGKSVRVSKLAL